MDDTLVAILRSGTPLVYGRSPACWRSVPASGTSAWRADDHRRLLGGGRDGADRIARAGIGIGIVLCVLASALLWFVIEVLRANPIIAGLGLTGSASAAPTAVQAIYGSQASVNARSACPPRAGIGASACSPCWSC
jgi:simple sugar transport system permease protein